MLEKKNTQDTNNIENKIQFNTIEEALNDFKQGKIIIVVDDENRENEGDFVTSAELITAEKINFMAKYGRGLHCAPLTEERCEQLNLHPMVGNNTDPKETAFTVSVDLLGHGVTTGISASDRAKTVQALMNKDTLPHHLSRPGHIFPLRAKNGGVLRRPGHTEAAIDLSILSGLKPGGVIVEIMNEDGTMARVPQLIEIAKKFDLKIISIEDLISYRLQNDSLIKRINEVNFQSIYGEYKLIAYQQTTNEQIHFAMTKANWSIDEVVPVRVKSTNTYFDLFSALHLGEKPLLKKITDIINQNGKGAIIFINNVADSDLILGKFKHYQDYLEGTNSQALMKTDQKDYGIGAQIIKDLGIKKIALITQNPRQKKAIGGYGLEIEEYIYLT
ncbi:Riboflavin biosynthesis protein ribBA [Candidatus Ornithobacterium hominis]|uniref:3,4-dihydroxy-2-butanone-4-phosphate synthase n=1 Tax=Candidatus Ornithobacterium hominis TaxID=2497989 RepID=UPI000E5C11DC|nr:3,4-dihydroxy-2-butanone-4-phosphate synthase [Candidatus Ornithobacterium hominis]SZD73836.1 Riboflavin biosynthesis protein ribBA [Candidatus Ornithobacterium hominis]